MKKTSAITIALIAVGLTFLLRLGPNIAHGLEETPTMNPVVSSSTEGIKALSAQLFTEVKNDADEKLWSPAMDSVEWFTATFLGEPVEAIRNGLETYMLSEEALDGFIAVAAFKIDQAVKKYLVANNRHTGPAEIETGQYTEELRRAVDVAAVIKSIYSGLIDKTPEKSELIERYYRFRKRTPGIDPPMELFVLVGSIAEALLKIEGKELDNLLKVLLSVETTYQTTKYNFQNTLKTGIISSRTQFNTRLRAILDKIADSLTLY